jgi:hypothetical protein
MRLQTRLVLEHAPRRSGHEELMMISWPTLNSAHPNKSTFLLSCATIAMPAGPPLFEVVHEIPLVPHWRGIARGIPRNKDRGPWCQGVRPALPAPVNQCG